MTEISLNSFCFIFNLGFETNTFFYWHYCSWTKILIYFYSFVSVYFIDSYLVYYHCFYIRDYIFHVGYWWFSSLMNSLNWQCCPFQIYSWVSPWSCRIHDRIANTIPVSKDLWSNYYLGRVVFIWVGWHSKSIHSFNSFHTASMIRRSLPSFR